MQDTNKVKYWEGVEAEKITAKEKALAEIDALKGKRPAILVREGEGDKTARVELEKLDANIARLKTDVEVLEAVLNTMPDKKARARSFEVNAVIPTIEKIGDGLQPLLDDVKAKTKPLITAAKKLYTYLKEFDQLEEANALSLANNFIDSGLNGLKSYNSFGKQGDITSVDIEIVLLQMVYDPERLAEWFNAAHVRIENHLEKMRHHTAWLADPNYPDPEWAYCPKCYRGIGYADQKGKCHCPSCGKTFDAEIVPGAKPRLVSAMVETE